MKKCFKQRFTRFTTWEFKFEDYKGKNAHRITLWRNESTTSYFSVNFDRRGE